MSKDAELERLKTEQSATFNKQQNAFQTMKAAGDRRSAIKRELDASWERVCAARETMNNAYESNQQAWNYYKQQMDSLSSQIEQAKSRADDAHRSMGNAFDRASYAYEHDEKASAPGYAAEGRSYQARRDEYNIEVKRLIEQSKSLQKPSNTDFDIYKRAYNEVKASHSQVQSQYGGAKQEHESAKAVFEAARQAHRQAKEAFQRRLNEVKAQKASYEDKNRGMLMVIAPDIGYMDGKQVKFEYRKDGKINVFFDGIGDPVGYGHGHIVIDEHSDVIYMRQPFKDKKKAGDIDIDDNRGIVNI
ncbi:hypothetical protein FWF48_01005 [Candidatus Saccharibacteria bacterium]|nr:hypothetical protein [Candidatus Saccharibacteria bacterium]